VTKKRIIFWGTFVIIYVAVYLVAFKNNKETGQWVREKLGSYGVDAVELKKQVLQGLVKVGLRQPVVESQRWIDKEKMRHSSFLNYTQKKMPKELRVTGQAASVWPVKPEVPNHKYVFQTPHFEFHSLHPLSQSLIEQMAQTFEATRLLVMSMPWSVYPSHQRNEDEHYRVLMFKDEKQYVYNGGMPMTSGTYLVNEKVILSFHPDNNSYLLEERLQTLRHEITHQLMLDEESILPFMPLFIAEGTAKWVEYAPYEAGKYDLSQPELGLKRALKDREQEGKNLTIYHLKKTMSQSTERWQALFKQKKNLDEIHQFYFESYLIIYYFQYLDGKKDGSLLGKYMELLYEEKIEWQAVQAEIVLREEKKALHVEDCPSSLWVRRQVEDEFKNLGILLNGRTYEQLAEEMTLAYAEIGFPINIYSGE
jgi:hypothetical protein